LNIPQSRSLGKYLGCPVFQGQPRRTTLQQKWSIATPMVQRLFKLLPKIFEATNIKNVA